MAASVAGLALVWRDAPAQRAWKERSVAELLAPVDAQLRRTRRAFERGDHETLRAGNEAIRELLLTRSHLIPPELRADADKLVEHYDLWLATDARRRADEGPAGPIDVAFPTEAASRFSAAYHRALRELTGR